MEKNLIQRMTGKLADFRYAVGHSKLGRRITTALLIATMAMPIALTATSCSGFTVKDNGDGSYTVTPNDGTQGGNNNQQGGNNQGGGNNTPKPAPDYSKYSSLLQEVLANPEYDALYRRYESGELGAVTDRFDWGCNLLEAIPYEYLASKGEDIEGIKNGLVRVNSDLYTKESEPNYIYDKINITYNVKDGGDYINQYLLKYEISEQELEDLTMLYKGDYYQGPVMFQYLASKQQPEVISEFSLTEKATKNIIDSCNNKNNYISEALNYNQISSCTMISLTPTTYRDKDAYDATIYLYGEMGNSPVTNCQVYKVSAKLVNSRSKVTFNNGTMDLVDLNALEPILEDSTPITYFRLSSSFKNVKTLG